MKTMNISTAAFLLLLCFTTTTTSVAEATAAATEAEATTTKIRRLDSDDKADGSVITARKDKSESQRSMTMKSSSTMAPSSSSSSSSMMIMSTMAPASSSTMVSAASMTKEPSSSTSSKGMMSSTMSMSIMTMAPYSSSKSSKGMKKSSKTDSPTAFPTEISGIETPPPSVSSIPSGAPSAGPSMSASPSLSVFPTSGPSFDPICEIPEDLGDFCIGEINNGLDYECVPDCLINSAIRFLDDVLRGDSTDLEKFCAAGCPCSDGCYCSTRDCQDDYQACFDTSFGGKSCNCQAAQATTDPSTNLIFCETVDQPDWGVDLCESECEAKFDEIAEMMDGCSTFCQCVVVDNDCFKPENDGGESTCCVKDCEELVLPDYENNTPFC